MSDNCEPQDFIVSSLLSELKSENDRKSKIIHSLVSVICGCIGALLVVICGFLWYLNQYDFVSETIMTSTGVYSLIDSEGNVIASDLTGDEIMEVLNGQCNQNSNQNAEALEAGGEEK